MTIESENAALRGAAVRLAGAEQKLADTESDLDEAATHVQSIRDRLRDVERRRADLRRDLETGKLTDREAAGLAALVADDASDLRELLAGAEKTVEAARAVVDARRADVQAAESGLRRQRALAELDALRLHVEMAERALLDALAAAESPLRAAGRAAAVRSLWNPSGDLLRAVSTGALPPRRGAR